MFIHPLMLAGLGGAAIPVLLHLLSRARHVNVEWGAMMFLDGTGLSQVRRARWNQWILLGIRMLLVALLAVAMARPIVRGNTSGVQSGHVTAVILLDCSGSMTFNENGRHRFGLAQRAAEQILAAMRPGDRVALIPMVSGNDTVDHEPTADLRSIADRVEHLETSFRSADWRDGLDRAANLLIQSEPFNRDIYIISDRQASSWRNVSEEFASHWVHRVASPSPGYSMPAYVRTLVVPVGNSDCDNVAVESVRIADPPAIRGQPLAIEVQLHNYSSTPSADVPLRLRVGDRTLLQTSVTLPAAQATWFKFSSSEAKPLALNVEGSQVISADIFTAGYTADDRAATSVDVLDPINVLLISGDGRAGQLRSETEFVRWALTPHRSAGLSADLDPCKLTTLAAENWVGNEVAQYQVVIIANVERFTAQQAKSLEQFVYAGGRVLVAPGNLSRIDDYNRQLFRDGAGILPARLEEPTPADAATTTLNRFDAANPMFRFLRGEENAMQSVTVTRHFPARPRQSYAWTLAWYATGDPFLVEGSSERGRVILMTIPLDAGWSTLPFTKLYLPMLQSAVRYLAADPVHRDLAPGDPIEVSLPDDPAPQHVTLIDPRNRRIPLDLSTLRQDPVLRYTNTTRVGTYRLEIDSPGKNPKEINFVVNLPLDESDLRQLTSEQWKWLEDHLKLHRIETSQEALTDVVNVDRSGRELWLGTLVAFSALLLMELFVAGRISGGPQA